MYKEFQKDIIIKNITQHPYSKTKISNIIIHFNYNKAIINKNNIYPAIYSLTQLVGQTPQLLKTKDSLSHFKVRKNMEIRAKVSLGKDRINNLIQILLLKINEWSERKFNKEGNMSMALTNLGKLELTKIENTTGVSINFNISNSNSGSGKIKEILLSYYGINIKKD